MSATNGFPELAWLAEHLDVGRLAEPKRAAVAAAAQEMLARLGAAVGPTPTGADELTDLGISYAAVDAILRQATVTATRQPGAVCPVCLSLAMDRAGRRLACQPHARLTCQPPHAGRFGHIFILSDARQRQCDAVMLDSASPPRSAPGVGQLVAVEGLQAAANFTRCDMQRRRHGC